MPYELFWTLNPRLLKPFQKAYETQREIEDEKAWQQGVYFLRAVSTALDGAFNGKKATTSYPEKPFSQMEKSKSEEEMSDEEMSHNHEALFTYLNVLKVNFDLEHPEKRKNH